MAKLPTVLSVDDLPLAELCAARIDGELMMIDEGWAPVDEPDLPALRAAAVALRAPRALVIERDTAAWVHGAVATPPVFAQFCVPRSARVAAITAPRLVIREVSIADADIVDYPQARCTSLARTGFDLLRDPAPLDPHPERIVAELCRLHPGLADELLERVGAATRMPHRGLARTRMGRVEAALTEATSSTAATTTTVVQPSLTR